MRGWKTYTSVREFAIQWTADITAADFTALPDKCPGVGEPAIRLWGIRDKAARTGTVLKDAGTLDLPLTASETSYLLKCGVAPGAITDADVAALGISRNLFARLLMLIDEWDFTRLVMGLAKAQSILAHHCSDSTKCPADNGLPDVLLTGFHHLLFAELKLNYDPDRADHGHGERRFGQRDWDARLKRCSVRYALWTPKDLPRIPAELTKLNEPAHEPVVTPAVTPAIPRPRPAAAAVVPMPAAAAPAAAVRGHSQRLSGRAPQPEWRGPVTPPAASWRAARSWGYAAAALAIASWWLPGSPLLTLILSATAAAYFLLLAPGRCGAVRRDGRRCAEAAPGLVLGCTGHRWRKLAGLRVPRSCINAIGGVAAVVCLLAAMVAIR